MEEDSYVHGRDLVHRVHRRDLSQSSSRPIPYHRRVISSSSPSYQPETSRETSSSSSGSDDNLTWATEDLKNSFRNVYRRHGSLQERRALNKKYKHMGCDQCAAKGIECDVGDTALRCGHCPAYVKCSRIATLKELRVIDIMDIPKEQYDCLLRWYQKDKEDELLEPLRDTFAKASMAVSHISESTAQPKLIKTRVQNPYPPSTSLGADSQPSNQTSLEAGNTVSPTISEHVALDEYASYPSLGSNHPNSSSEAHESSNVAQTAKSMAARTDLRGVNAVPQTFLDCSSPYALSPLSPLSTSPSSLDNSNSPDSSVYQNAPTPAVNTPSPYRSPHLYAPVPLARFHGDSLLKYGNSRDAEISSSNYISNTISNSGQSPTTRFSLNDPYPVTWNDHSSSSTDSDGSAQTMVPEDSRSIASSQYGFDFSGSFESYSQHLVTNTHSEDVYPQAMYQSPIPYNLPRRVTGTPLLPQFRPLVEAGTSGYYTDSTQYLRQGYDQNQSPWEDRLNRHQQTYSTIASHTDGQSLAPSLTRASGSRIG